MVDGPNAQQNNSSPVNTEEWHLPTFDPRNENKYLYRLHTVDIYFWTKEDAQRFLSGIRRVLPTQQVTIVDEPAHDAVSSIVQNLEQVAITHADTRHSRGTSISSSIVGAQPLATQPSRSSASSGPTPAPAGFAPLAYNPAAPAAPEAIMHREKTPPPEDGAANPLVAAAAADQGQAPTFGVPYNGGGFSGPPPSALSPQQSTFHSGPMSPSHIPTSPAPQVQSPFAQHFQNHFAPPPTSATISANAPPAYEAQSPSQPAAAQSFTSFPIASTSAEMYNPGIAPPGGFAQFDYNPGLSNTRPMMTDYSIHSQIYRPTEGESKVKTKKVKPPAGNLEARAGKVEKGVNGLLKKLEKKVG